MGSMAKACRQRVSTRPVSGFAGDKKGVCGAHRAVEPVEQVLLVAFDLEQIITALFHNARATLRWQCNGRP